MAYRVIGIGNAVMDVIAPITDAQLEQLGIVRGVMALVERDRSDQLTAAASGARLVPGGDPRAVTAAIKRRLAETWGIGHSTVEVVWDEASDCALESSPPREH